MIETETKVFGPYFGTPKDNGIDSTKLGKLLLEYGAKLVFDGIVATVSYKPSGLPAYNSLVLRKDGKRASVLIDDRHRVEAEIYDELREIFENLGFKVKRECIKELDLKTFNGKSFRLRDYYKDEKLVKTVLGLKEKISTDKKNKSMNEHETPISGNVREMIRLLGFESKRQTKKFRKSYKMKDEEYGKVRFDIDTYTEPVIPTFLEIESSEEGIEHYINKLRLQKHERRPWDTQELFDHYFKTR